MLYTSLICFLGILVLGITYFFLIRQRRKSQFSEGSIQQANVIEKVRKVCLDFNEISKSVENNLGTNNASYKNYREKYSALQEVLQLAIKQVPESSKDDLTAKRVRQLELLVQSLSIIEDAHKDRELRNVESVNFYRVHFSNMCSGITDVSELKLE